MWVLGYLLWMKLCSCLSVSDNSIVINTDRSLFYWRSFVLCQPWLKSDNRRKELRRQVRILLLIIMLCSHSISTHSCHERTMDAPQMHGYNTCHVRDFLSWCRSFSSAIFWFQFDVSIPFFFQFQLHKVHWRPSPFIFLQAYNMKTKVSTP